MNATNESNPPNDPSDQEIDVACEVLYRYLAAALSDVRDPKFQSTFDPQIQQLAAEAADLLRDAFSEQPIALGFGELPIEDLDLRPALYRLHTDAQGVHDEYRAVFGLITSRECPPYETEFHANEESFFRSQQMADIAGFYRAFGIEPSTSVGERPDHLSLELEFAAYLLLKKRFALSADEPNPQQAAVCQQAREAFFRDHLIWWSPAFSLALRRKAEQGFLADIGKVLGAFLPIERFRMGVDAPRVPIEPHLVETREDDTECHVDLVDLKV